MDLGIAGRRAAVAAASKGLGYSVAAALVAEGVQVAVCGREADAIGAAAAKLGGGTVPIVADVSSVEGATAFVTDAREALGGVDILIANAGGPPPGNFSSVTVDQYLEAFELNCRSTIAMCYESVPAMREQQWGRVVAITSIAVRQPIPQLILSNTARAGRHRFSQDVGARDRGRRRNGELAPSGTARDRTSRGARRGRRCRAHGGDTRGSPRRSRRLREVRRVPVLRAGAAHNRHGDPGRRRRRRRAVVEESSCFVMLC